PLRPAEPVEGAPRALILPSTPAQLLEQPPLLGGQACRRDDDHAHEFVAPAAPLEPREPLPPQPEHRVALDARGHLQATPPVEGRDLDLRAERRLGDGDRQVDEHGVAVPDEPSCGATRMTTYKSPGGAPAPPARPRPGTRSRT